MKEERTLKDFMEGYFAPDGKFYGCKKFEHNKLAEKICKDFYKIKIEYSHKFLEKRGWLLLTTTFVFGLYDIIPHNENVTQAQLNTIYDWSKYNNNIELPKWIKNVKVENID